ncbi:MAG: hypothetical protein LBE33_04745 [Zoogloeaceae bacterium]|jgi:hypothetical protein|nr:hypothetical protein [Zoogloeaceae bacterium]
MSKQPIVRANPQTAEDKQVKNYIADWWIYAILAFFIGGLIFMTYALTLRGEIISEFGKPKATAPAAAASSAPAAQADSAADKK